MDEIEQATAAPGEKRRTPGPDARVVILSGDPEFDGSYVVVSRSAAYLTLVRASD